jgi:hypothetical protein
MQLTLHCEVRKHDRRCKGESVKNMSEKYKKGKYLLCGDHRSRGEVRLGLSEEFNGVATIRI